MRFDDILKRREKAVKTRWLNLTLDTYPADSSGFLKNQKNQFLNPVGNTISREIGVLYRSFLTETDPETIANSLDSIIRIRSVQEFSPSQATGFILLLKRAVREELADEIRSADCFDELQRFESKVDEMALAGFDAYARCRERLFEVKLNELRRQTSISLARYNRTGQQSEQLNDS